MVSLSNHAKMALLSTYSKESCRLIQHTKTSLILPLVLSGGNASGNFRKSGKDLRFGLWETPRPGRFSPMMRCWTKPGAGAGGPRDRNNRNTNQRLQRSRWTARLSHLLNSQTRQRAWQRPAALQAITAPRWRHRSDARRHRFPTAPDRSWRQSGSPPCRRSSSPAGRTPGSCA